MFNNIGDDQILDYLHHCPYSGAAAGTHMGSPVYLEAVLHHTTLVVSCYDLATFVEGTDAIGIESQGKTHIVYLDSVHCLF